MWRRRSREAVILLLAERLALDLQVRRAPIQIVDFDGHGADLQTQRGAGFVDQVDGLIGQEAVGDVAVREHGGGEDGRILDAHAVVDLEFLLEAAQNGDGVVHRRLAHQHGAETARQGGILFDVLLVLVERGGADAAQFAARQRRLEQVGRVDGAFRRARADQGVQLIDEADDLAVGIDDFLDHRLEAVFEFAAELGAGDHAAEVDRHQLLVLELIRHVAADDALGEAFHDGGLADARFADQHRVVLGAAAEHLHHAADLVVAADHRIEFALTGGFGEIVRVAFQRLVLGLRILVGDALRAAHGNQGLEDGVVGGAGAIQQLAGRVAALLGDAQQQVFGGNEFVLEADGLVEGVLQDGIERRGEIHAGLHVGSLGQGRQQAHRLGDDGVRVYAAFLQHRPDDALFLFRQGDQQVQRVHHLAAILFGYDLALLQGVLRLLSQFVNAKHIGPPENTGQANPPGYSLPSKLSAGGIRPPPVYIDATNEGSMRYTDASNRCIKQRFRP